MVHETFFISRRRTVKEQNYTIILKKIIPVQLTSLNNRRFRIELENYT